MSQLTAEAAPRVAPEFSLGTAPDPTSKNADTLEHFAKALGPTALPRANSLVFTTYRAFVTRTQNLPDAFATNGQPFGTTTFTAPRPHGLSTTLAQSSEHPTLAEPAS